MSKLEVIGFDQLTTIHGGLPTSAGVYRDINGTAQKDGARARRDPNLKYVGAGVGAALGGWVCSWAGSAASNFCAGAGGAAGYDATVKYQEKHKH